jgi:hypothetical protein
MEEEDFSLVLFAGVVLTGGLASMSFNESSVVSSTLCMGKNIFTVEPKALAPELKMSKKSVLMPSAKAVMVSGYFGTAAGTVWYPANEIFKLQSMS